jgi:hypothetical protein
MASQVQTPSHSGLAAFLRFTVKPVRRTTWYSTLLFSLVVVACGGNGDGGTDPPPPPTLVSLSFCGTASDLPLWFAAQSGTDGPWTAIAAGASNTYTANVNGLGGVAWVKQNAPNDFSLVINYGTVTELTALGSSQCRPVPAKTVTGTVAGLTSFAQSAAIGLGGAFASPFPDLGSPDFTIANVADGPQDLAGILRTAQSSGNPPRLDKLYLKRGINPSNNSSVGVVDFDGPDAFVPETRQITMSGTTAVETGNFFSSISTSNGATILLGGARAGPGVGIPPRAHVRSSRCRGIRRTPR